MGARRKPLAFNTTMRNPARMAQFVSILANYKNQKLTSDLIFEIEAQFIRQKVYIPTRRVLGTYKEEGAVDQSPQAAENVSTFFEEWSNSDPLKNPISVNKVIYLLKNTITKHKEKGYEPGWESRFQTHISFCNELGFTYIAKDRPIRISATGELLISKYKDGFPLDEYDSDPEHTAYLNAFAKYQTNNPWRRNTVCVNFLYLFLSTVKYLDEKYDSKGVSRKELPFFIVWPDNNYKKLAKYINDFRKVEGNRPSDEVVYDYALNILDESPHDIFGRVSTEFKKKKSRDYKFEKITRETPDDVIRKLRQSQTISFRGAGSRLDINHFEDEKVNHIISNYGVNQTFSEDFDNYFKYMGTLDPDLEFTSEHLSEEKKQKISDVRIKVVNDWADNWSWDQLKNEIGIASRTNSESKDKILREINRPTRLEFLAAIIMQKSLSNVQVIPHYKVDDEGIPYDTASGGSKNNIGTDIDVIELDTKTHALLEPTVSAAGSFQTEHELPSITKHIINTVKSESSEEDFVEHKRHFAIFLAGKITEGVGTEVAVRRYVSHVEIYPWETDDYVDFAKKVKKLNDYAVIRKYAEPQEL